MCTVLVIEDEEAVRRFVAVNLRARGYEVIEAANGKEGLDLLKSIRPSLVLLDLRMPVLDGWQVLNMLRSEPGIQTPPIFLMTANVIDAEEHQLGYREVNKLLFKPMSEPQLVTAVREAVGTPQRVSRAVPLLFGTNLPDQLAS